jgi:hypothetical protein
VYNYPQLRSLSPPPSSPQHCDYIFVSGFPKSGLQGFFEWRPNSPEDDDGGTVIKPNTIPMKSKGRWHRIYDGPISVRWFGATGDGDTNQNAMTRKRFTAQVAPQHWPGRLIYSPGLYQRCEEHRQQARQDVRCGSQVQHHVLRRRLDQHPPAEVRLDWRTRTTRRCSMPGQAERCPA